MQDLTNAFVELIRRTSTDLPGDMELALRDAREYEAPGSAAHGALDTMLVNQEMSRRLSRPSCQDTGTPIFEVHYPVGWSTRALAAQIKQAVVGGGRAAKAQVQSMVGRLLDLPGLPSPDAADALAAAVCHAHATTGVGSLARGTTRMRGGRMLRMSGR